LKQWKVELIGIYNDVEKGSHKNDYSYNQANLWALQILQIRWSRVVVYRGCGSEGPNNGCSGAQF